MLFWIFIFQFFVGWVFGCRLDHSFHGIFQRQFGKFTENELEMAQYEKVVLSSSSSNIWGDCYENFETNSYIFGLKRMGRPTCFRCITMILRSQNIVQVVNQDEKICHETVEDAKKSCFGTTSIEAGDGTFLFKSENMIPESCGLEGKFRTTYRRLNTVINCSSDSGTMMQNCDSNSGFKISFKNCSFPDFEQDLICLGIWPGKNQNKFAAILDKETKQYYCGMISSFENSTKLSLTNSANCESFHENPNNSFEEYTFSEASKNHKFVPCRFPEWLQGEYEGMIVQDETIKYRLPNSPSINSMCVEVDGERILVHSEAGCDDELGYHCLWFRSRSNAVIEFKTTEISSESVGVCKDENEFEKASWTTLISKSPQKQPCAFFGSYSTPKNLKINDCFNLTVDCITRDSFKLVAYHCDTGIAYDVKNYYCYGTWRENENLYVYAKTEDSQTDNVCFISRQQGDQLYLVVLGSHCSRTFNFSENADSTLVLQRTYDCQSFKPATILTKKTTIPPVLRYAPTAKFVQGTMEETQNANLIPLNNGNIFDSFNCLIFVMFLYQLII